MIALPARRLPLTYRQLLQQPIHLLGNGAAGILRRRRAGPDGGEAFAHGGVEVRPVGDQRDDRTAVGGGGVASTSSSGSACFD